MKKITTWFMVFRWGASSLVSLYLSLISGVVLALQFDVAEPYYSTGVIELIIPFGSFWRALHFYASQVFFIFSLVHFITITLRGRFPDQRADKSPNSLVLSRLRLSLSLPLALLLVFSGYILRGDATGTSAGNIAENITLSFPVIGSLLNVILFRISEAGLRVVYVNHLAGFLLLWGYLSWEHLRRYPVAIIDNISLVGGGLLLIYFLKAPLEPHTPGVFLIRGPWFFVGLQELLHYLKPFWAGIFFPLIALGALAIMSFRNRWYKWGVYGLGSWCLIYFSLTIIGYLR